MNAIWEGRKFTYNDMVVPITKTKGKHGLEHSHSWRATISAGQRWLYVKYYDKKEQTYSCSHLKKGSPGDLFAESDLTYYLPSEMALFAMYIVHDIDQKTYGKLLKKINNSSVI